MTDLGLIGAVSIIVAGLTIAIGSIAPALGEARAAAQALQAIAQQPDEANTITRTLFVSLAMIEIDSDLLLRRDHDPDFCQPVLECRPEDGGRVRHANRLAYRCGPDRQLPRPRLASQAVYVRADHARG